MATSTITTTQEIYSDLTFENLKEINIDHGGNDHDNSHTPNELVLDLLKQRIANIDTDTCDPGEEDAFYVADLGEVYRQHVRWETNLPRVIPFYAVKCNPDTEVLRLLDNLGTGFDCASQAEIERILNLGINPDRIIYAQPCKTKSYIRYAREKNVKKMTFDNADELYKIKNIFPDAELLLRIDTDDSASLCCLSNKFGAHENQTDGLLKLASQLSLKVVGVSFHVGSGATDPGAFDKAVKDALRTFKEAKTHGYELQILDVGGGFQDETFEGFAIQLRAALDYHFPASTNTTIIAEPGRYYVARAFTLATTIIARRGLENKIAGEGAVRLYVNDGVYGNFSNIIFDHQHPQGQILWANDNNPRPTMYSIWGPTCDGIDRINEQCSLPSFLDVGDWLYFPNMGAYTKCSATRFNGFSDDHSVIYTSSHPTAKAILQY